MFTACLWLHVGHRLGARDEGRQTGVGRREEAAAMVQWEAVVDRTRVES